MSAFAPSSDTPVLPPILDSVLTNRGIMDRRSYFCSDWDAVPSPFSLSGLSDVVERIDSAIDNGDRIGIYGDYDCDGIAATAILRAALRLAGCQPAIELPTRAHGYGLTADAVHRFSRAGIRLLIAVDNGISAHSAIRLAWRLGIDVIVIDHHSKVSDPAEAVVLWDPSFCGASLSLMVAWGLLELRDFHPLGKLVEGLNRVATIAAVADCIPLIGPVRLLTRLGLRAMPDTPHAGLRALLDAARIGDVVRASDLAWRVCPALNAPGRLSTPTLALDMLTETTPHRATALAEKVLQLNVARKQVESRELSRLEADTTGPAIVAVSDTCPPGIAGILAARLAETHGKPSVVLCRKPDGTLSGSARSAGVVDLAAALRGCDWNLRSHGGHAAAAGLSMTADQLPAFRAEFASWIAGHAAPRPEVKVEGTLTLADYTPEFRSALDAMEPFGHGNPAPVFRVSDATIDSTTSRTAMLRQGNLALRVFLPRSTENLQAARRTDFLVEFTGGIASIRGAVTKAAPVIVAVSQQRCRRSMHAGTHPGSHHHHRR